MIARQLLKFRTPHLYTVRVKTWHGFELFLTTSLQYKFNCKISGKFVGVVEELKLRTELLSVETFYKALSKIEIYSLPPDTTQESLLTYDDLVLEYFVEKPTKEQFNNLFGLTL